jgi:two-component system sensor histidine kinase BaeS
MPRLTLQRKVFLALAALLAVLLLIFAGFSRLGLQRGLGPYVAEIELSRMDWLAARLVSHHAKNGNWEALRDNPDAWHRLQMGDARPTEPGGFSDRRPPGAPPGPPPDGDRPPFGGALRPEPQLDLLPSRHAPPPPPDDARDPRHGPASVYQRLGLTGAKGAHIAGATVDPASAVQLALKQADSVIGYLVLAPLQGLGSDADHAFVAQQSRFVIWTGLAGLVLALLLSWLVARRWFAPIGELMEGARGIAQGRLATRIPVRGQDELATLARSFNRMAQRLDGIEASRRAWLSDVAHELRTPLAAMRAEIEALQDGIRPFDDKTALRLHRQVMRLGQLVDDMRLSMGDAAAGASLTMVELQPLALLREAIALMDQRFARAGIAIDAGGLAAPADTGPPVVHGDAQRLHQVFMNLLENSLRYTDAGGFLRISAQVADERGQREWVLQLEDSAPGVAEDELPRVFDRLFRGEASRSRAHGGSGLGLAICRSLVEAHGGRIEAGASTLGGLRITLALPLVEDT